MVKLAIVFTALSTLGGASWAGFEFYKDYMDMREIVQNIDVGAIEARNAVIETKLDEAIEFTRDIKGSLRQTSIVSNESLTRPVHESRTFKTILMNVCEIWHFD